MDSEASKSLYEQYIKDQEFMPWIQEQNEHAKGVFIEEKGSLICQDPVVGLLLLQIVGG